MESLQKYLSTIHGSIIVKEETRFRIANTVQQLSKEFVVEGVIPMSRINEVRDIHFAIERMLPSTSIEDLTVGLATGERAPEIECLELASGETERLFSMNRKGRPMVLLFVNSDRNGTLTSLLMMNDLLQRIEYKNASYVVIDIAEKRKNFEALATNSFLKHMSVLWAQELSWNSPAVLNFGVRTEPCCFLMDEKRSVVWRGHPILERNTLPFLIVNSHSL